MYFVVIPVQESVAKIKKIEDFSEFN